MIGAVFVLLAADIAMADVRALGWAGAAVVATLVLIVRPLGVWMSIRGTDVSRREQLFLSAIAPRGIVAAAMASLMAGAIGAEAAEAGLELRALVFLVIAGTVVFAGVTAWPLAKLLGLRLPARDRIVILGAQGLGLALARELRTGGHSVVVIDTDPQRCRIAEDEGFTVVFGDGLQERTLRRIPIEYVGTAIGATFNDNLNSQFVRLARHTFGVKRGYVSVDTLDGERSPEHVTRHGADVLFEGAHDQERWDVRVRQREVDVIKAVRMEDRPVDEPSQPSGPLSSVDRDLFVVLSVERNGRVLPMSLSLTPKSGDRAAVAVYRRERDKALALLESTGWRSLVESESGDEPAAPPVSAGTS